MVNDPRVTQQLSRLGGLYRDPSRVDRDASALLKSNMGRYLVPICAELYEDNGTSATVFVLQGTVAIHYKGQTYQLLVDMYIPKGYPQRPPVNYVRLAERMYIKDNHPHVAPDGKVYLPYLHEWSSHSHNLVELVVNMSSVFSDNPPVFSRNEAPQSSSSSSPQPPPPSYDASRLTQTTPPMTEARLAQEAAQANEAVILARRAEEEERLAEQRKVEEGRLEEVRAKQARERLTHKIQMHLRKVGQETQKQVQNDWRHDAQLQKAAEESKENIKQLEEHAKQLKECLATTRSQTKKLQEWIQQEKAQSAKRAEMPKPTADAMVHPASAVDEQMLELAAENAALEDALYYLDSGLYHGQLDYTAFLKQVRRLAKRQFLVRAHLKKIEAVI